MGFVVNHSSGADVDLLGYLLIFRHVYPSVLSTAVAGGPSVRPIVMSITSKECLKGISSNLAQTSRKNSLDFNGPRSKVTVASQTQELHNDSYTNCDNISHKCLITEKLQHFFNPVAVTVDITQHSNSGTGGEIVTIFHIRWASGLMIKEVIYAARRL